MDANKTTCVDDSTERGWFDWPEFNTDRKRIKAYSKRYSDITISEAFAQHYNLNLKGVSDLVNYVPQHPKVGDLITTKILSINKDKIVFDTTNLKSTFYSSINLYKYARFKQETPSESIDVRVTRIDKDKIVVDPITPMFDAWLTPIIKNPSSQKIIPADGAIKNTVLVKDLKLSNGGFIGKAVIPSISSFVGEDYVVDAFIPGSQIVLNITDNFEQFIGKSVHTFVLNYIKKPGSYNNEMSLICSAKEVLKFAGECNMINIFNSWCEGSEFWQNFSKTTLVGRVTGVINTSKKCGVFIEIPSLNITGMVATGPEELVNYKPHSTVSVRIDGFDEEMFYNHDVNQMQHVQPYEIEDGVLKKCNLKPILKFADE